MSATTSAPRSKLPRLTFQGRITAVAMTTAACVLFAACVAFGWQQWRVELARHRVREQAAMEMFSQSRSVQRALLSGEPEEALVRLRTLHPHLAAAFVESADGRPLAGFGAGSPAAAAAAGLVEARAPIVVDGRLRGTIVAYSRPPSIAPLLPGYLELAAALFVASAVIALALGRWLARRVTRPVARLSRAMKAVAESGDFAQRVQRLEGEELGRLTDSFNHLLDQLHENDQALRSTLTALVDARDAAESANRLKSQFLANMSHEIRTPLNGLLAMTQVVAMETRDRVQAERLEVIRQSGEALLAILNDVLDVSKIEAGKLELEEDEFDAEAVVRGAVAAFSVLADRKDVRLALEVAPSAQGRRRGDAARLRQIISNLVSNALKFTHSGDVKVSLDGDGSDGATGLRLTVADTGIGIPAAALPHLFEKFTQADSSTTRRFGGTGLGLAICRDLCVLMGGEITAESEEGLGSVFSARLPLPRTAGAPDAPAEIESYPLAAGPLRVLAAEDNPTNRLVLATVMEVFGVELSMVGDGRQAVEAWRDGRFDVILMDIQMPEMDGLEATRAIRAGEVETGRSRTPIVALSAHALTHQVKEYLEAGVDLHVPKPIQLPRLRAALEEARRLSVAAATAAA